MSKQSKFISLFIELFFSILAGGFFLALTYVSWQYSAQVEHQKAEARLKEKANTVVQTIERRVNIYTNLLHDSRALFMASDTVTRDEWRTFVQNIELVQRDPGVNSLVYLPRVYAADKENFIQETRQDASNSGAMYLANFTIFPDGEKSEYFPIYYVEPVNDTTFNAVGYDHSSETIRNQALELARDTGDAQLSATFKSVNSHKNAFVMYIPVFQGQSIPSTLDDKRKLLKGYIFAGFTNENIFPNIIDDANIDDQVSITFYDGEEKRPEAMLFERKITDYGQNFLSHTATVQVAGRPWTIQFTVPRDYGIDATEKNIPRNVALVGLLVSGLAFGFVYALLSARRRAVDIANQITENLQESEEKYRAIFESFQDVYYQTDMEGKITVVSPSIERWTGLKPDQLVGKLAADFYPNPDQRLALLQRLETNGQVNDFEIDLRGENNSVIKVSASSRLMVNAQGSHVGVEGVLRDISDRKKVEEQIAAKNEELERMNKLMTGRELKMIELKKEIEKKTPVPQITSEHHQP